MRHQKEKVHEFVDEGLTVSNEEQSRNAVSTEALRAESVEAQSMTTTKQHPNIGRNINPPSTESAYHRCRMNSNNRKFNRWNRHWH